MSSRTKLVCLIAAPRTGSSYICDLLDNHPDVESHSELFHREATFIGVRHRDRVVKLLRHKAEIDFDDYRDQRLVEFAHREPQHLIQQLQQASSASVLFFKLFPRHLDSAEFERTILRNSSIAKLILDRDRLATFVSLRKAVEKQQWSHSDTSQQQVRIDAHAYARWWKETQAWYDQCRDSLRDASQPFEEMSYESLTSGPDLESHLDFVVESLRKLGVSIRSTAEFDTTNIATRPKQNRNPQPSDSIANFKEFLKQLKRTDLDAKHHPKW